MTDVCEITAIHSTYPPDFWHLDAPAIQTQPNPEPSIYLERASWVIANIPDPIHAIAPPKHPLQCVAHRENPRKPTE